MTLTASCRIKETSPPGARVTVSDFGPTRSIERHCNVYWSSTLSDGEKDQDRTLQRRDQQPELPYSHVSRLVDESSRPTTVAPEIREFLTALAIDTAACRRWLSADPPDVRQTRATIERITSNANALIRLISVFGHYDSA